MRSSHTRALRRSLIIFLILLFSVDLTITYVLAFMPPPPPPPPPPPSPIPPSMPLPDWSKIGFGLQKFLQIVLNPSLSYPHTSGPVKQSSELKLLENILASKDYPRPQMDFIRKEVGLKIKRRPFESDEHYELKVKTAVEAIARGEKLVGSEQYHKMETYQRGKFVDLETDKALYEIEASNIGAQQLRFEIRSYQELAEKTRKPIRIVFSEKVTLKTMAKILKFNDFKQVTDGWWEWTPVGSTL